EETRTSRGRKIDFDLVERQRSDFPEYGEPGAPTAGSVLGIADDRLVQGILGIPSRVQLQEPRDLVGRIGLLALRLLLARRGRRHFHPLGVSTELAGLLIEFGKRRVWNFHPLGVSAKLLLLR